MTDFSPQEVERVAKGLTRAQRELLFEPRCIDTYKPFLALRDRGLVVGRHGRYGSHLVTLTDFGLAVRQHLIGTGEGGRDG